MKASALRTKGINFDTGFLSAGTSTGAVKGLDGQSTRHSVSYADMPWEPKAAFATVADFYSR